MRDVILMEQGSGGKATSELIDAIFSKNFNNDVQGALEDAAVVPGDGTLAITTDSFVVTPLMFPGGDIGRLSVCGTVNDLAMRGAVPKYLTCGYIIKEGTKLTTLEKVAKSMAECAREAGVTIVAGDTKVIEGDGEDGIMINTAGVGFVPKGRDVSSVNARKGDVIIASGTMGEHHAAILSQRLSVENSFESDNAPLNGIVEALFAAGVEVHTLRDVTRGGLGTVLKELAEASGTCFEVYDKKIPVTPAIKDFCGLLGLDPMYMGNEGKLVAIVKAEQSEIALNAIKACKYGDNACIIGEVTDEKKGQLIYHTAIGGVRNLDVLVGEGLPRIC